MFYALIASSDGNSNHLDVTMIGASADRERRDDLPLEFTARIFDDDSTRAKQSSFLFPVSSPDVRDLIVLKFFFFFFFF